MNNCLDVVLGNQDKIISDIHNDEEGWAGFCISNTDCPIGEVFETDAKTDIELNAFVRIVSTKVESLDALIAAIEKAKTFLPK